MKEFFPYSLNDIADWLYKTIAGLITVVIGYFAPIKDLVHMVILFFLLDMFFGYLAARKLRGEKFSTKIVWKTTFPRMLISLVLIIMAFLWDTTCNQQFLPTYNLISWFISGVLIFSIAKNGYKITNWEVFPLIGNLFQKKIKDQTGVDITEN